MKYGSDLIVDLLNEYDVPYVAMNPGATVRGIHDSIVNYADHSPRIIQCPHEEISVGIAHGYAKVTGRPMAAMVHNVVGLLHSAMAIYTAYTDRVPVMILGATGPMAVGRRRPRVDWDHTALVQGNAVRDYVKWDDQPWDAEGVLHSFSRAYRIACTEPTGPVYLCFDVAFQEDEMEREIALPDPARAGKHTPLSADLRSLEQAADYLLEASNPVIVADHVGRNPERVSTLVELAELVAAPVVDLNGRMNFPNTHPLFELDCGIVRDADLVLMLDVRDEHGVLCEVGDDSRPTGDLLVESGCRVVSIGLGELEISSWSNNNQRFLETDISILGDTLTALPDLLDICRKRVAETGSEANMDQREARLAARRQRHADLRAAWVAEARSGGDSIPMSSARMVLEVGEAIKEYDWVLTANTVKKDWARRLWDMDEPHRHPGKALGTATQISISLGVALAYKGSGKLVVDLQPDGDLLYDAAALWVAARYSIPMLVVMHNNRAYYNSVDHQERIMALRGRGGGSEQAEVGTVLNDPAPDFAELARSMGWYAEGPVHTVEELGAALERAIDVVQGEGRPALVDAVTLPR